jgi:gliding motility-associated-like protein
LSCINLVAQLQGNSITPGVSYDWTGPNNFTSDEQSPDVTVPGEYILNITGPNGCSSEAMIEVLDISELIIAEVSTTDTISCMDTQAELSGTGSSAGNNIEYIWIDSNNDTIGNALQQTVMEGGLYTLIVFSNYSGCSAESQVFVEDNSDFPTAEISTIGNQSITCENSSILLSGEGSGPLNEIDFEWFYYGNMISDEVEIQISEAGEYILQIINFTNGCTSFDTIIVEENMQLPEIDIITPLSLNCIDTLIQIDASNSSTGNEFEYQWMSVSGNGIISGANSLTPLINEPGQYLLIIENNLNGCADSASVTVLSNTEMPAAEAGEAEDIFCENPTTILNGNGSSIGPIYTYQWTGNGILNGADSLIAEVNQTGTFTLLVTNAENGCTASDLVSVGGNTEFISGAIILAADPDCLGQDNGSIQIESAIGGEGPFTYSIDSQPFVQYNTFNGLSAGNYELTVMDASGCEWDTLITLDVPTDIFVNLGEDMTISLGDSINLEPQLNVPLSQIDTFVWQFDYPDFCNICLDQWVTPIQTTTYSITVYNESGCRSTDEVTITVDKNRSVYVPNAFSPNNDGNNDKFMIYGGRDVSKINSFQIFNRWGAVIFERNEFQPNDPQYGWDGTFKDQTLNPGVFVYFAEIEFIDGRVEVFKGDLTLFR